MSSDVASVRRHAHARTDLFLGDPNVVFRDIRCMGGVVRREDASAYHTLAPAFAAAAAGTSCWHCCEPIAADGVVVPLPRAYDDVTGAFHVYGRTCSPGCAKAYIIEHTSFDRSQHLALLFKMLREAFGVVGPVVETPPRAGLRRFGGPFDPSRRAAACTYRLLAPPFVSHSMLVEERVGAPTVSTADPARALSCSAAGAAEDTAGDEEGEFAEPAPPPLFDAFVATRSALPARDERTSGAKRKRLARQPVRKGPLAGFLVTEEDGDGGGDEHQAG